MNTNVEALIQDAGKRLLEASKEREPLLLTPGQEALSYSVAPERTAAPLMAGAYRATVDFRLNYD